MYLLCYLILNIMCERIKMDSTVEEIEAMIKQLEDLYHSIPSAILLLRLVQMNEKRATT